MKRFLSFVGTGISHVIIAILAFWACGSVLSACSTDGCRPDGGLTGGESVIPVTLEAGSFAGGEAGGSDMDESDTKAIPATGMHEDDLANIWVLQFNTAGTCVRSQYYPAYNPSNFTVTLSNGTAQTVVFVANTFDSNIFKDYATAAKTWNTFQFLDKTVTEGTVYTGPAADHYLIISGIYKGNITSAGLPASVHLKRAVAKVKFTYSVFLPTGDAFTAKNLQLCRVPKKQAYLEPGTIVFPTWAAVTDSITYPAVVNPAAGVYMWYLTENARGTGTGSTSFDKNAATAPSGQTAYCTYVNLQGDYKFNGGATIGLSYKFYLGADVTSDYNVRRNNIYDLTVRITGANAADQRIAVTSANGTWGVDTDDPGSVNGGGAAFN